VCSNKTARYCKKKDGRSKNAEENKTRETKCVVIGATEICTAGPVRITC
jgi:hypothetical protein